MTCHTPEQAAILALLARVEALEARNRSLEARLSSVVAMQRAGNPPRIPTHLPAVLAGLEAKRTRQ